MPDFNSPTRTPGHFRRPGIFHIHIGSTDSSLIDLIGNELNKTATRNRMCSDNTIIEVVAGRQAKDDPEMFDVHNDAKPERFLTFGAQNREDTIRILKYVLTHWEQQKKLRIEAERSLLHYQINGQVPTIDWWQTSEIYSQETGFCKDEKKPKVETHLCFDLVKKSDVTPITLTHLNDTLEQLGISVMSWSLFESKEYWSYRSSAFVDPVECEDRCKKEWSIFRKFLRTEKLQPRKCWLAGELLLGLWKAPFKRCGEMTYKSQVSFGALIGVPNFEMPALSEAISEGGNAPAGTSESTLSVFNQIIMDAGLEPVLLELAINHDLSRTKNDVVPNKGKFTSHIVSYDDSTTRVLLDAWQQAIRGIVENSEQQINPIVFHDETYKSGCLLERVDWAGQAAHLLATKRVSQPKICGGTQSAMEEYAYKPEAVAAPVHCTLRILSAGLVAEVAKRRMVAKSSVQAILKRLKSAYLFVVPFNWLLGPRRDSQWGKGGCLFAVVGSRDKKIVEIEKVARNVAMRCGTILSKAALTEASEQISPAMEEGPFDEGHLSHVNQLIKIKQELYGAMSLNAEERLDKIMPLTDFWLKGKAERRSALERRLKIVEGITEAFVAIIEEAFPGGSKSTADRWRRKAGYKDWTGRR